MKRLLSLAAGTVLCTSLALSLAAETLPPGQVDFGNFAPPGSGREFVEVNLTSSLISLAARFVEKEDAEVAKVLNGLQLIRVNVIGLDDTNKPELQKRVQKLRKELDGKGWERIVTVQKDNQDVGVYLKTQNKDTVQGLVVLVMDNDKEAVFVNVVGDIKPEQLSMLGEKLHLEPLKKIGEATK